MDLSTEDLPLSFVLDVGGEEKAKFVKELHTQVQERIREKGKQVARQVNKGRKKVVFEPGDWVWVHLRKIRFPDKAKGKLAPRGDGPFLVLERINDNAYVIDLPGEYNVSCTFNVANLSPFEFVGGPDLRTNPFQEGEDDTIPHGGPVTRSMARRLQEGLSTFIQKAMREESMKTEEPTMGNTLKNEGQELIPGRVTLVTQVYPDGLTPLESPCTRLATRAGTFVGPQDHPGGWSTRGIAQTGAPTRAGRIRPIM